MAMPLLLVFSALASGARPVLFGESKRLKGAVLVAAMVTILLLFHQGGELRAYFVRSPFGGSLATFRSEVASLTPEGGTICAALNLDAPHEGLLIAEMSGENGFRIPPIGAAQVYLLSGTKSCPASGLATHITISLNARGDYIASG